AAKKEGQPPRLTIRSQSRGEAMKMKKRVIPALLASMFMGAAAPAAQAQQFSGVYVFGDSLSDAGYFRPVLQAAGVSASLLPILGRFTTAPGPVWSELVSNYYGM